MTTFIELAQNSLSRAELSQNFRLTVINERKATINIHVNMAKFCCHIQWLASEHMRMNKSDITLI